MDDILNVISKTKETMSNYVLEELRKKGYGDFYLSHGAILINFKDKREMNYKELSERINKSPQTMTTLIRKLEKDGYITLHVDKNDKRNKLVRLSKKGREFIPVMMNISKKMYEIQYNSFDENEEKILRVLLHKIMNSFEENRNEN